MSPTGKTLNNIFPEKRTRWKRGQLHKQPPSFPGSHIPALPLGLEDERPWRRGCTAMRTSPHATKKKLAVEHLGLNGFLCSFDGCIAPSDDKNQNVLPQN